MIFNYLKHKATIYSLLSDIIVLGGALFYNFDAIRCYGFFCLDIVVMILFFVIYMKRVNEIEDYLSMFVTFCFLCLIMYIFYFDMVMDIGKYIGITMNEEMQEKSDITIFYPYYDIGIFLVFSFLGNLHITQQVLKVKQTENTEYFEVKSVIFRMMMIPVSLLIAVYMRMLFKLDINLAPIISFILLKNFLEYWKYKALMRLKIKVE